jgi:hypothetical protein
MGKLHTDSKGFSVIELLLIIAALAIIGGVGYFVAKHVDKKTPAQTATKISSTSTKASTSTKQPQSTPANFYKSPDGVFSITYPAGWLTSYAPAGQCGNVTGPNTCVGSIVFSLNKTSLLAFTVTENKSNLSPEDLYPQLEAPIASSDITNNNSVNGYSTFYDETGSPDSYVDVNYVISHNGYAVDFYMRKIYVDANAGINDNFSQYTPTFTQMVGTIKFYN